MSFHNTSRETERLGVICGVQSLLRVGYVLDI